MDFSQNMCFLLKKKKSFISFLLFQIYRFVNNCKNKNKNFNLDFPTKIYVTTWIKSTLRFLEHEKCSSKINCIKNDFDPQI